MYPQQIYYQGHIFVTTTDTRIEVWIIHRLTLGTPDGQRECFHGPQCHFEQVEKLNIINLLISLHKIWTHTFLLYLSHKQYPVMRKVF